MADKWKQWETEQAEKEAEETKKRKQELAVQQEVRHLHHTLYAWRHGKG